MTNEAMFAIWAPDDAVWSRWAKPVLFAEMRLVAPSEVSLSDWRTSDVTWAASPGERTAIILDLPGVESVATGLALAERGYRPVPLFNACPGLSAIVPLEPTMLMLDSGTGPLQALAIPLAAPPVFLLDAARMSNSAEVRPGRFDNRWMVFPQDFPSGNFLRSRGIERILLVQRGRAAPQDDLAHVLLRWRETGLALYGKDVDDPAPSAELTVSRPSRFKAMWYRALAIMGLRRNSAGGFGSVVPQPSAG